MKQLLYRPAIITFLLFTLLAFVFAVNCFPLFTNDSLCFVPTSYFLNHTGKLVNPFYDGHIDIVQHRFLFYPPLFIYVYAGIAQLVPKSNAQWHIALTLLNTVSILLLVYTICRYIKQRNLQITKLFYLFIPALIMAIFSFQDIISARPEILCRIFISLFILNNLKLNRATHFVNGLIICLNGLTSPISTFYLIFITGYLLAYRGQFKWRPIIEIILGALPAIVIFVFFYPYHITDLLHGIIQHSKNVVFNREDGGALKKFIIMHVTSATVPFSIFTFLIAFCYILVKTIREKQYLALLMLIGLTAVCSYFTFNHLPLSYNLYVLSPVVCFIIPLVFTDGFSLLKPQFTRLLQPALILLLFINSTGLLRKALVLYAVKNEYVNAASFRKTFLNTFAHTKPQKKIAVSLSLWPYCIDKADRVLQLRSFSAQDTLLRDTSIQYVIMQQNITGLSKPIEIPNYRLIEDQFNQRSKKIMGIPILNTYPGYQVAIYERK